MSKIKGFSFEGEKNGALVINDEEVKGITLAELAEGYKDNSEEEAGGVYGWNGKLEIRPKFQRSYVVENNKVWQTNLVNSVLNNRPTGVMYFGKDETNGKYINIDGQQRLMTLLSFINGETALYMDKDGKEVAVMFNEIPKEWQRKIKNYTPLIKVCRGGEKDLLSWFETINQPISELTKQELRNASYNGTFVEAIKRLFAKVKASQKNVNEFLCDAKDSIYSFKRYTTGKLPERQDVVEFILDWVSFRDYGAMYENGLKPYAKKHFKDERIETYMGEHRNDLNADDAKQFYTTVVEWVNDIFFHHSEPKSFQSLASQDWDKLYLMYHEMTDTFTEDEKKHITKRCADIIGMGASLYAKTTNIYEWVLRGEKYEEIHDNLQIRAFKPEDRDGAYIAQGGFDPIDGKHYEKDEMETHHIVAWANGGATKYDNLVLLGKETHKQLHLGAIGLTPEEVRDKRNLLWESIASKQTA